MAFVGVFTALVTPFRQGVVDERRFEQQISRQISGGVDGIVPVGTTGESPTLDFEEHERIVELAVSVAAGRVPVIAGTGGNSTAEAVRLTQAAEKAGADASLQVVPYYNRPTQQGLTSHFRAIASATSLPIILYNIPSRCGVEIAVETVVELAHTCPTIVGIKEAGGNCNRVSRLRCELSEEFSILSGDDALTLPFMSVGAHGVISVVSNVFPNEMKRMVCEALRNDYTRARALHKMLFPLVETLFVETNPAPVKYAMKWLGLDSGELRLPLVEVRPSTKEKIECALTALGCSKQI
ncbi:MAG: Dihydrodipicolinate synthase [Parcubacteria group bacterium GW2011_GWA1_47_9]|nr:MAG: Dihydrodipicolinate synthase [Parcubacteria group bacterium GW2011_GWA1_47_9]